LTETKKSSERRKRTYEMTWLKGKTVRARRTHDPALENPLRIEKGVGRELRT